jgi:hypothetical protein
MYTSYGAEVYNKSNIPVDRADMMWEPLVAWTRALRRDKFPDWSCQDALADDAKRGKECQSNAESEMRIVLCLKEWGCYGRRSELGCFVRQMDI